MNKSSEKRESYIAEIFIVVGYIAFFFLAFILLFYFLFSTYLQPHPTPINAFASSLPPTTPTPHISLDSEKSFENIVSDDFNNDQYEWEEHTDFLKAEVKDGKLLLESLSENTTAIAECQLCDLVNEPYFIQADFSTNVATDQGFGIVFNRFDSRNSFFLFEINTEAKRYNLYRHVSDTWALQISRESYLIKSFPDVNTLGVYLRQSDVEFYINGEIVDSYTESGRSFQLGRFGLYSGNSGFKLVVDNLSVSR
jgi:hypothetical protein